MLSLVSKPNHYWAAILWQKIEFVSLCFNGGKCCSRVSQIKSTCHREGHTLDTLNGQVNRFSSLSQFEASIFSLHIFWMHSHSYESLTIIRICDALREITAMLYMYLFPFTLLEISQSENISCQRGKRRLLNLQLVLLKSLQHLSTLSSFCIWLGQLGIVEMFGK